MRDRGGQRTREEARHWLPSQGVDPAPLAELNAECLGHAGHARGGRRAGRAGSAAVGGAARRNGPRCRRRRCGGCPPRPSACSTPASRRRRAGSSCAPAACTNSRNAREPAYFDGRRGALDHAPHAGLRLAPRAQPAARRVPGVRLHASPPSNRWRPVRSSALEAAAERNADALRPRWSQPDSVLARVAGRARQPAPTAACTSCCSAASSALPRKHSRRMLLETPRALLEDETRARSNATELSRAEPANST